MILSSHQIDLYNKNGFLQIENCFSEEEIEIIYHELPKTVDRNSARVIYEANGSIRSIFAPHYTSSLFGKLMTLERFVFPCRQLLKSDIYIHQYKINTKKGLKSDWWEWHQDFPYWYFDDGIKRPDMITVMLYLQNTNSLNGALLLIPKSQCSGIVDFADKSHLPNESNESILDYSSSLSSNIKFTISHEAIFKLAKQNGITVAEGSAGSVLFFHPNIFHASNINLTPFDRDAVLLTYNSTQNLPANSTKLRPEFLASRNFDPIINLSSSI